MKWIIGGVQLTGINIKPLRQMEYPINLHAKMLGWSIVYIKESQVIISKIYCIFSAKINFVLANIDNPYEKRGQKSGISTLKYLI